MVSSHSTMQASLFRLLLILTVCGWATSHTAVRNRDDAMKYLDKYGYNSCANKSKDVACSVDSSSLLRKFQQFYGLKTTGVFDAATMHQMNQPRCANSDVQRLQSGASKWSRSSLTWSLRGYPEELTRTQATAILHEAFGVWFAHIPLQIKETCSTCSADIVIDTGRLGHNCIAEPFDGPGNTLAHAFYPEGGKIHFDADEKWTERFDQLGINFFLVAVHEIGHALGLQHNKNQLSIMYAYYQRLPRSSILSEYDRKLIQSLYGSSNGGGKGNGNENGNGVTCNCPSDQCCSKWGYCGTSEEYCGENCVQGSCWLSNNEENEPTCNCPSGQCCSKNGLCGISAQYCGAGCIAGSCW